MCKKKIHYTTNITFINHSYTLTIQFEKYFLLKIILKCSA